MEDDHTEKHSLSNDFMGSERSQVDGAIRHPGKRKEIQSKHTTIKTFDYTNFN